MKLIPLTHRQGREQLIKTNGLLRPSKYKKSIPNAPLCAYLYNIFYIFNRGKGRLNYLV